MGKLDETTSSSLIPATSIPLVGVGAVSGWVNNYYAGLAISRATRLAYRSDVAHFEQWGGSLPTTPIVIVAYLEAFAAKLNPRTLARRLTALRAWHLYQGFSDPTIHPVITKTLSGISRVHGCPKRQAPALSLAALQKIILFLQPFNSLQALRDQAILQIGFFGALRCSELIAIQYEAIHWLPEGIEILIPQSKTDQGHQGQYCAIPYGNTQLCPVTALKHWLTRASITQGAIFRRLTRYGQLGEHALTPLAINHMIKRRTQAVGLTASFSSHSLRRGLATSAAKVGAPLQTIMRAGRWRQTGTVIDYMEAGSRLTDNAALSVLKQLDADQEHSL